MTTEQRDRWRDWALRMARTQDFSYIRAFRRKPRTFRQWLEDGILAIIDEWLTEEEMGRIRGYDETDDPMDGRRLCGPYICDVIAQWLDEENPYPAFNADDTRSKRGDHWEETWGNALACCLRSGIDVACRPSAGVAGFTVGDVRKMYPEGLPDWACEYFGGNLESASDSDGVWL